MSTNEAPGRVLKKPILDSILSASRGYRPAAFLVQILVQALINTAVAVFIAAIESGLGMERFWDTFRETLPYSHAIGYSIVLLNLTAERVMGAARIDNLKPVWRTVYWTAVSFAGVYCGFALMLLIQHGGVSRAWFNQTNEWFVGSLGMSLIIAMVIGLQARSHFKALVARTDAEALRSRALASEKQLAEAGLKLLQAQIEPHFLFNTLANVHGLIDRQPDLARDMLGNFIHYLRASLHLSRQTETTLGGEVSMLTSYLALFTVRFGDRLHVIIDVPESLHRAALAPMLLQPLVENAIKHGLEPAVDGGTLSIVARREDASLVIEVRDTGLGFRPDAPQGVGLGNIRERLRALYGDAGSLDISEGTGPATKRGTVATVRVPFLEGV
jgi:signal transduction histidine kinase